MQIHYPRELTKKSFLRFYNQCLRNNRSFVCAKCGKEFKIGDLIFKFRGKYNFYCFKCYQELYQDIPDNILDENELKYIETGRWIELLSTH